MEYNVKAGTVSGFRVATETRLYSVGLKSIADNR
jgi:hypothetical protein